MSGFILVILLAAGWLIVGPLLGIIAFARLRSTTAEVMRLRRALEEKPHLQERARPSATPVDASVTASPPLHEPGPASNVPPMVVEPLASTMSSSPTPAVAPGPRLNIESVLATRWGVWFGAVALLLAGVFLLRYTAEHGLLGPATRCTAAALLGLVLLAAAEWLRRSPAPAIAGPFQADMAPSALAAGGVASLFAAAYGVGPFYHLLPEIVAFVLMAVASTLALVSALRFGPLTAAVGIVGAFVTPALAASASPMLPGLFAYLALVTVTAYEIVWRTAWTWLGWSIAAAAALWLLAAAAMPADPGVWAAAAYMPLAAFLGLLLPDAALDHRRGRLLAWGQFAIVAVGGLALEAAAPGDATHLALLLLGPLAIWKGADEPALDRLPWLAAVIGLAALVLWKGSEAAHLRASSGGDAAFLFAGFVFAVFHMSAGLVLEIRTVRPSRWSTLVSAVPVLALAVCYYRVGRFETDIRWGLAGLILVPMLAAAGRRALAAGARDCGGIHAAGAVAALALALVMVLRGQGLMLAFALMLPGLAWIEAKVPLPALRRAALVVVAGTLAAQTRWLLLDFAVHARPAFSERIVDYAVPAIAFFAASRLFRRTRDDALVATLEAGAISLASLFALFLVRRLFGHASLAQSYSMEEIATLMLACGFEAIAYAQAARKIPRPTFIAARSILGAVAGALALGLLVFNPLLVPQVPISAFALVLAYLAPAILAACVARCAMPDPGIARVFGSYAILAGLAWITLAIRHVFHPVVPTLWDASVENAELWIWSGGWLIYGIALMLLGIGMRNRLVRLASLALVALVCAKVFLLDMSALTGLWRVSSFLGLGLSLIGLSVLHRRFVLPVRADAV